MEPEIILVEFRTFGAFFQAAQKVRLGFAASGRKYKVTRLVSRLPPCL